VFQALGSWLDRYWTALVGVLGVIALALFGTIWQDGASVVGEFWFFTLVVVAAVASGASGIYNTIRFARRARKVESELFTAVRTTLVPLAEHFIDAGSATTAEDAATLVTMHCRAFVARNGATCDANLYKLSGRDLVRVNRTAGSARKAFNRTRKQDAPAVEATRTVERVMAKQTTFCPNVASWRWRRKLDLAPGPRTYSAFISVPLCDANGTAVGMLSLNSSKRGVLTSLHQEYLEAVGRIYVAWNT